MIQNWTNIRTALIVGKLGTVSAAARSLGIHRATVNRQLDTLEQQLGRKLFKRHVKGYSPTELGTELMRLAEAAENSFHQLLMKAKMDDLDGDFVVSSSGLLAPLVYDSVRRFKSENTCVSVQFNPTDVLPKLEYGEADIALVIGQAPEHLDYVVRPLVDMKMGLYVSEDHRLARCERGSISLDEIQFVRPIGHVEGEIFERWMDLNVSSEQIVLTTSTLGSACDAVVSGIGAGFLPRSFARRFDWLTEVLPPRAEWKLPIWAITHVDVHRTAKTQSFLKALREQLRTNTNNDAGQMEGGRVASRNIERDFIMGNNFAE